MVKLVWITPDADNLIAKMARVSNPAKENDVETAPRLINYLMRHKHWSPFEMADMCVDITTTRDIGRQILRHRSFSFQEYSLRYSSADILSDASLREARMQHPTNRQASVECDNANIIDWWDSAQAEVLEQSRLAYEKALRAGIAKEVARAILPEGLTTTRMYMKGSIRSWIHFCQIRMGPETQKETREIATQCWDTLKKECPNVCAAASL